MSEILHIHKLDAARRQLQTAITLWFADGDPIAIHTLSFAAYEIIHVVSKKRGRTTGLMFDSEVFKDKQERNEINLLMKSAPNFFKHAKEDFDATIEFDPRSNEILITFALIGLDLAGEKPLPHESAFLAWTRINRPHRLADKALHLFAQTFPAEHLERAQRIPKDEFLERIMQIIMEGK
ncbi:MAG: hypothetical protein M3R58_10890 [Pseudomonadota bacterium]|nr:hypothetical protein [Pseudomonadota bacterium]